MQYRLSLTVLIAVACGRTGDSPDAGPARDASHDLSQLTVRGEVDLRPLGDTTGVEVIARCDDKISSQTSADDGSYELIVDVAGCEPLVIEFRKPSYLPVLAHVPLPPPTSPVSIDATLKALQELQCNQEKCVEEGRTFSEFPSAPMKQGWVTALSGPDAVAFAGGRLRDQDGNVLWLTAFGYFEFEDAEGALLEGFDAFPGCFTVDRDAYDWLVDESPGTGTIDMSTYSLDPVTALWSSRTSTAWVGYGARVEGEDVILAATEDDLASIRSDQFETSSKIYICAEIDGSGWLGFGVTIEERACLVVETVNSCDRPLASSTIEAVGRDHGYRAQMWTDPAGQACIEVARSEAVGDDYDADALGGEEFFTNLVARREHSTERLTDQVNPGAGGTCAQPSSCQSVRMKFATDREGCP